MGLVCWVWGLGPGVRDPGCREGMLISPMPHLGPEASQRISLAIFIRLTARDFNMPLVSTAASWAAWASKWLRASVKGKPVWFEIKAMI